MAVLCCGASGLPETGRKKEKRGRRESAVHISLPKASALGSRQLLAFMVKISYIVVVFFLCFKSSVLAFVKLNPFVSSWNTR